MVMAALEPPVHGQHVEVAGRPPHTERRPL